MWPRSDNRFRAGLSGIVGRSVGFAIRYSGCTTNEVTEGKDVR